MEIWKAFAKGFAARLLGWNEAEEYDFEPTADAAPKADEVIKEPPMEIDGRMMSADEFVRYVEDLEFPKPLPNRIFLHHTWKPTLETWRGHSTIMAMKAYYEKQLWVDYQGRWHEGWNAGPHLFVADDGIWLFSDLRYDGVGAKGYNERSRHLEMVGNYDAVLPSGPMLANTIAALGILHERLGLDVRRLSFHRDVSSKTCPGTAVRKEWIIPQIQGWIEGYRNDHGGAPAQPLLRDILTRQVQKQLVGVNPDATLAKASSARGHLGAITHETRIAVGAQRYVAQIFAEALIVPEGDWDSAMTLDEFEKEGPKTP